MYNGQELSDPETLTSSPLTTLEIADLNNDGPLDAVCLAEAGMVLLLGHADTSLTIAPTENSDLATLGAARTVDVVDVNRDGLLDMLVGSTSGLAAYINMSKAPDGWLDASLIAEQIKGNDLAASGRVNNYGIGRVLELRSGAQRQRELVDRPTTHCGLEDATEADAVRVL